MTVTVTVHSENTGVPTRWDFAKIVKCPVCMSLLWSPVPRGHGNCREQLHSDKLSEDIGSNLPGDDSRMKLV
jgi:hypothetical protein